VLIIDGTWSVLGSTNFDNRSFGLNDEVNVAILERTSRPACRPISRTISPRAARSASTNGGADLSSERVLALLGRLFERQQ